jgi:CRISPR system Cascade subunit CasC
MGVKVYERLRAGGIGDKDAKEWASQIAMTFGKLKGKKQGKPLNELEIEQLAHFGPDEVGAIRALADRLIAQKQAPSEEELKLLRKDHGAVDIALFGRMLADSPGYNTEAACQVAHAVSVHRAPVEDDFFTAVDDLNTREEDAGSAHMGEQGFGAGLFYLYVCLDYDLLKDNLDGDDILAKKAVRALVDAAVKVSPTGKQNSFASRAHAYYALAEKGERQPRSLSLAYMRPVREGNMLSDAIDALENMRGNMDKVYYDGKPQPEKKFLALPDRAEGTLRELLDFVAG